jgi:RimJ/RimL family protein N-acetyltransferase
MQIKNIFINVDSDDSSIAIKTIDESYIYDLMEWKNNNREYFFNHNIISSEQQLNWYKNYIQRDNDFMFVVIVNGVSVGCMGIRKIDNEWDVYNVILGLSKYGGNGIMFKCFQNMLKYINQLDNLPISLKVLKNNPAIGWYEKNGFTKSKEDANHFEMIFQG